jgi:hypothetical protein
VISPLSHRIIHSTCCNFYGVGPTPRYTPHDTSQRLLNPPSLQENNNNKNKRPSLSNSLFQPPVLHSPPSTSVFLFSLWLNLILTLFMVLSFDRFGAFIVVGPIRSDSLCCRSPFNSVYHPCSGLSRLNEKKSMESSRISDPVYHGVFPRSPGGRLT